VTVHKPGTITIITNKPPVLQGYKAKGLWSVTMEEQDPKREKINSVYSIPSTEGKIKFLHAAAGYPVEDTWTKAINAGNYLTWPGLSAKAVRCNFPESNETQKGHMKKQRRNVRLTRIKIKESVSQAPSTKQTKMQDMYIKVHNVTNTMYSSQMGCFPALSRSGNQYIMVLVEVDGNYIDAEPMKNRSAGSMIKAYLIL
jgi:hypothetical protein